MEMKSLRQISKAVPGDYPPYTEIYMKWLPNDGMVLKHLVENFYSVKAFIYSLPPHRLLHRYRPDKWSLKEILVHIIDDERIFSYRALRFGRAEQANLSGFDQDRYAFYSQADERHIDNIFDEYEAVRMATITLFNGFPDDALERMGHGTGTFNDATVSALAYHIAGHEQHHINIIKEKYLNG